MTIALPPYVTRELVEERLPLIFPEGIPNRNWCVRQLAASTVFAMLYIGAVKDTGRYLGPIHVYRMTDEQSGMREDKSRLQYGENVRKRNHSVPGERWYADNTREPIRDETPREGLVNIGAVFAREDLPTTSSNPRYALECDFAALFDPFRSFFVRHRLDYRHFRVSDHAPFGEHTCSRGFDSGRGRRP